MTVSLVIFSFKDTMYTPLYIYGSGQPYLNYVVEIEYRANKYSFCTPQKNSFALSAPIRQPLNIYFSACRINLQGQNALRTAPRN
jgi:hypothetical protein